LNGETKSKAYPSTDRQTSMLFGDGGAATLIEKKADSNAFMTINSDGAGHQAIIAKGGGYRNPTSSETLKLNAYSDGSIRSDEHGSMDGGAVFDFTLNEVPKDIRNLFIQSGLKKDDIDYFVFHQANKFMTDHFSKKLDLDMNRVIYSIEKYGNTASVSIPLTIVSELANRLTERKKMLLSGFGVGLSWGSVILEIDNPVIVPIIEI
jgi:3-oxoacyl-[acyl-carrier-protein] synthase-3